jgi:3-(3-hydroxy-phenyl)propionate hydroxylase
VLFIGDSAHVVSPFGARGGNGGIQDVDNIGWKLAAVLQGQAGDDLIETYNAERVHGSAENILNSTRATNFMTPKSPVESMFRDEVLRMAHDHPFARRLINSGRLSLPCSLAGFDLQTPGEGPVVPGQAAVDAPLDNGWLIEQVQGRFVLVGFGARDLPHVDGVDRLGVGHGTGYPVVTPKGTAAYDRYGETRAYLFRPDGHVAAVFDAPTADNVAQARDRALGQAKVTA